MKNGVAEGVASDSHDTTLYVLQHYDNLLPVFVIAFLYRIEYLSLADCYLLVVNGHKPKTLLLVNNLYCELFPATVIIPDRIVKTY